MPKTKISKPILYGLILLVIVGIYCILTPTAPTTPPAKRVLVGSSQSAAGADSNGVTQADLDTHFAHYTGGARDPFVPGVIILSPADQAGAEFGKAGEHGGWALTGINSINGVASAVIENNTTGDAVFLEQGDHWNGLRVAAVESDSVVFENALGQKTTLTFNVPDDNKQPGAPPPASPSSIPSLNAITQLPALPPMQFGRRVRAAAEESTSASTVAPNESSNEQ